MIDYLKSRAKAASRNGRTGWARYDRILVAYYPRCKRTSYFLKPYGVINRRDLEAYINEQVNR